jgi:SAM-dependent methyltransferase
MANESSGSSSDSAFAPLSAAYWQGRYDAGATGWDRGAVSPTLGSWIGSGALPRGRILVPGCGRGHEVVALAGLGFRVTGLDFAPAAVREVRGRLAEAGLEADVVATDLFAYAPAEPFDAIYEQTCLCAFAPTQWEEYERRLASWLVPGGRLAAAFMQTSAPTGPPFSCPPDAMRRLFGTERWEWPDDLVPVPHPLGLVELTGILRRRPS